MKANLQLLKKVGQFFHFLTFFVNPDEKTILTPAQYPLLQDKDTIRLAALGICSLSLPASSRGYSTVSVCDPFTLGAPHTIILAHVDVVVRRIDENSDDHIPGKILVSSLIE